MKFFIKIKKMNTNLFKKPIIKNIFSALMIAFTSFVLLNLTFIFDFFIQSLMGKIFIDNQQFPSKHLFFLFLIILVSWKIMTSKLNKFIKAVFLIVLLAVVYATIGIVSYPNTIISITLGGLISTACFIFLKYRKLHWYYYFSLILISLMMLIVAIFRVDI